MIDGAALVCLLGNFKKEFEGFVYFICQIESKLVNKKYHASCIDSAARVAIVIFNRKDKDKSYLVAKYPPFSCISHLSIRDTFCFLIFIKKNKDILRLTCLIYRYYYLLTCLIYRYYYFGCAAFEVVGQEVNELCERLREETQAMYDETLFYTEVLFPL